MRNKLLMIIVTIALLVFIGTLIQVNSSERAITDFPKLEPKKTGNLVLDSLYTLLNDRYQAVKPILVKSCFDCHSTSVNYPWYHALPGINTLLDDHVKNGLEHLDLSNDFPFKSRDPLDQILHELKEEVEEGGMPLLGYRLIHWGTLIEGDDQKALFEWVDSTTASLALFNNKLNNASETLENTEN